MCTLMPLYTFMHRRLARDDFVVLVEVLDIGLPVNEKVRQLPPLLRCEQDPDGEVVHQRSGPPRAGSDGRVRYLAAQLLQVPGRRLLVAGPGFVGGQSSSGASCQASFARNVSSLHRHISWSLTWRTLRHFGLSVARVGCTPGSCQKSPAKTKTGSLSAASHI